MDLYKAKNQGAHLTVYLLQNNVDDVWLWAEKAGLGRRIWVVNSEWPGLGWERGYDCLTLHICSAELFLLLTHHEIIYVMLI